LEITVKSETEVSRLYKTGKAISNYKAESIFWLKNKKLGFKRLGKVGEMIAEEMIYSIYISEFIMGPDWFLIVIAKGMEEEFDKLQTKVFRFFDNL